MHDVAAILNYLDQLDDVAVNEQDRVFFQHLRERAHAQPRYCLCALVDWLLRKVT